MKALYWLLVLVVALVLWVAIALGVSMFCLVVMS